MLDVPYRGCVLHFWDLGGARSMRSLWGQYAPDAQAIVFVVDAPRWIEDARVPEESDSSYRDAACAALFGVVRQVAASNGQSVCVLVGQTDVVTVKEKHSDAEAVVRDVKQGITQRWEELARGAVDVGTLRPVLHYMRASAKTGYARDWRSCVADLQRRNSRAGGAPVY